ncbi:MAG: aminoglycoside 6-adenylyltransferase [Oscillospiraceae bacterium]|jgi:aminoglycoside 6-adenylyltransferase|nr:aminoglycoside 6-adenylyltransferase [Oscillospiraceae bacterium]
MKRIDELQAEDEMIRMTLNVARNDERIRAVSMEGSRANLAIPKDQYQDYDITFYVHDIEPFYNNPSWVIEKFGVSLIMQMPEAMRNPCGDGNFNYMMIYPDGKRLDLSFHQGKYIDDGQPSITLLDKDNGVGLRPPLPPPNDTIYHTEPPSSLFYYSCCNNFWWCLNNVAKGIARDELSYTMNMLNIEVRSELHDMIRWYIGTQLGFDLSTGKDGRFFKRFLSPDLYEKYKATYSGSDYTSIWIAIDIMCDLFHTMALSVAEHFNFTYRQDEEDGIREYLRIIRENIDNKEYTLIGY